MRIQHNIMAMNAYRNYNTNTSALSKNLEKLSSGYKINRAGDDAAGLAISEKMRAQITGLNAAQKNVKDGISLVKTAEGAMQEIQDMLNRMDYLATQSANGTYQDEVDRENLQKEVEALKTEIDRIADSANFNGIKLLDGSLTRTEAKAAETKTVTIAGANIKGEDRMLSTDFKASNGKAAWEQVGIDNIYDNSGPAPQSGSFDVDISDLEFTKNGTVAATGAFTLTIGDTEIKATGIKIGANATAATVKKAVFDALKAAVSTGTGTTVTINGTEWKITGTASQGKLTFTQTEAPAKASQARTNFDVKVNWENKTTAASKAPEMENSHTHGTITTQEAVAKENDTKANTVFTLKQTDLVDGAKIQLGGTTVVLKIGKEGTGSGTNLVDLSEFEYGNVDMDVVLSKISKAFGSSVVASIDNKSGTFIVGVDKKNNGLTVYHSSGSGAWTNKEELGKLFSIAIDSKDITVTTAAIAATGKGLTLQIGDTADDFNQLTVGIGDMHVDAMGKGNDVDGNPSTKTIKDINIGTLSGAQEAISVIKNAINYVSGVRGDLGAAQNRLEHTANNLSVMAENITDAESTIRDTDVAEEMMAYTKNNILIQSAQAMLAQANAVPQGVLQLLG